MNFLKKVLEIPEHIDNLNEEVGDLRDLYGKVCERVTRLETDMKWVRWLTMGIAMGIVALVAKAYWPVP